MYDDGNESDGAAVDVVPPLAVPDLLRADPGSMSGADLVDAIAESERVMSAVAAWQMRALAAFAVPGVAGDPYALAGRLAGREVTGPADSDPDVLGSFVLDAAQSMAAGEVAATFRISPVTAGVKVRDAIRMCTELPATLAALSSGVIDRGKARVIAEYTAPLPAHLAGVVEGRVLPIAAAQSTAATRKATAAAVIAVDPRGAQERHEQARKERGLLVQPGTDGMSTLKAYLTADGAVSIFQLADLLATHTVGFADDDRSISARRVDALTDLAGQILTHGQVDLADYLTPDTANAINVTGVAADIAANTAGASGSSITSDIADPASLLGTDLAAADADADADSVSGPAAPAPPARSGGSSAGSASVASASAGGVVRRADQRATRRLSRQGRRPHLQVTLGLETLAGLDDLPADLAGYGAITAGMARTIAASAGSLCTLLADPTTGAVTHAGTHQYRPRQDLRDHLTALADSCRFPSCRQPAWRCDIDHRNPYNHRTPGAGGPTTTTNLDPLCRRHHLFKHHTDWTLRRDQPSPADPAGMGVTWRSPTGHTYPDPPRQVAVPSGWIVRTPEDWGCEITIDLTDLDDSTAPAITSGADGGVGSNSAVGLDIESDTTAPADIRDHQSDSSPPRPAQSVTRRPVTDRLEHRHLQCPADPTQPDVAGGSTGDPGAGTGRDLEVDRGPSMVEDDLVSLLLHQHLREQLDRPRAADADSRTPPDARDARDDPPPF
ncbi:DUF222 domain-containing protein [Nakamurella flavida]|uniref:DUF222 domain-containing protein n=1 Tax=Nakamurella flavida TaxID=363630 RepID=A0A938YQF5_9ACTN|nr:HNH endonuclease signature motif containing protein [Nakamurella flavida]MBM9477514.1 DUF222 domain-containing protein [Nakamurella flavida]MDP9777447.1 hypothetical protein [Nakamurella flavida]